MGGEEGKGGGRLREEAWLQGSWSVLLIRAGKAGVSLQKGCAAEGACWQPRCPIQPHTWCSGPVSARLMPWRVIAMK